MSLILDACALIAFERGNPVVIGPLDVAAETQTPVITSAAVVAQAWRNPAQQVALTRLLRGTHERSLDAAASPTVGELLRRNATTDVPDAALAALVRDGDEVLTSDPSDIKALLNTRGIRALITTI